MRLAVDFSTDFVLPCKIVDKGLVLVEKLGGLGKNNRICYNTRIMPKRTYQPKTRQRAKVHGFRARMATKSGQTVLKRRRNKARAKIAI